MRTVIRGVAAAHVFHASSPARTVGLQSEPPHHPCVSAPNVAVLAAAGRPAPAGDGTMFQQAAAWQKFSPQLARRNAILFLFGQHALSSNRFPLFSWSPPKGSRCRRNPQPGAAPQGRPAPGPPCVLPRDAAPAPAADPVAEALALDRRLAAIDSLEDRLIEITRSVPGRVTFSTSLGIEDQAVLHAIAASGAKIDVFTLDTGRHFPETLDTLEASENRYGLKIRVMFPDAREVEELVARDGIYGFRLAVENRKACCDIRKVRPLKRALEGAKGWVTGLRREQSAGPRARAVRRVGRGERARQAQPDRRLEPRAARGLRRRQQRSRSIRCTRAASPRSAASRARAPSSPARTFAPDAGGGRTRTARNAACTTGPARRKPPHDGSVFAPRPARGRGHLIFSARLPRSSASRC